MNQIYKIAICDDQAVDRDYLSALCRIWSQKNGDAVEIFEFISAENFLFCYEDRKDYDILLLDIEMGEMDGISMARKLRQDNDTVQIVFITGYSDYISDGYEVDALHYLMKPVKEEKLSLVLDRAAAKIVRNGRVLNLFKGRELVRMPLYQIRYAEVRGNYITIYGKSEVTVKMPLTELEKRLDYHFFRVGRSVLVNLAQISRVTKKEVHLLDGSVIPISRGAYESANQAIIHME